MAATRPKLRLDNLPGPQRRLWDELGSTPPTFTLYGGTALALQLGHRQSVDFDFFSFAPIEPARLLARIPYLAGGTVVQQAPDTLTCRLDRTGEVLVSFFGLPSLKSAAEPVELKKPKIRVAALEDIAGMKMAVVTQRVESKDYVDIHAILTMTEITLVDALVAAQRIYGPQFNALLALKALAYLDDPALASLPKSTARKLASLIKSVDVASLPGLMKQGGRRST